jgi:hypothetical protein
MKGFLIRWLLNAIALMVVVHVVPGVRVSQWETLAVAALVLGFLNAFLRPVLLVLSLPVTVLTLGLFYPCGERAGILPCGVAGLRLRGCRVRQRLCGRARVQRGELSAQYRNRRRLRRGAEKGQKKAPDCSGAFSADRID